MTIARTLHGRTNTEDAAERDNLLTLMLYADCMLPRSTLGRARLLNAPQQSPLVMF